MHGCLNIIWFAWIHGWVDAYVWTGGRMDGWITIEKKKLNCKNSHSYAGVGYYECLRSNGNYFVIGKHSEKNTELIIGKLGRQQLNIPSAMQRYEM